MTFHDAIRLIKRGDVIEVRRQLESGLDPNFMNEIGTTMLMLSAIEGKTAIGSILIESGAEIDLENKMQDTALSLAAWYSHPKFVSLLLERGASVKRIREAGSLDSFLAWVEEHCEMTSEQLRNLRNA